MMNNLKKLSELPTVYERSEYSIWRDEYISNQMLKNHLDPLSDGASRNHQFITKSVDWISREVPSSYYPRVLDLGCGPGIYSELFCRAGYQVVGVDFSKTSISYAIASALKNKLSIKYICDDYLNLSLDNSFDLITLIYCDYGALSKADRRTLVTKMYELLVYGGRVLLDVFSTEKLKTVEERQSWNLLNEHNFWSEYSCVELERTLKYPNDILLEQTTILTTKTSSTYNVWTTYFTLDSLLDEFLDVGFKLIDIYGDVCGTTYSEESETIAILLEK